ncbi:MAG: TRIC cation channel family protein [Desulfosarcina sp.]|nr:TRIC cation channel family protein [Desulfosarcina sp.]
MGVITGIAGGMIRDVLTGRMPIGSRCLFEPNSN